jgi:hypothetical protein
MVQIGLEGAQQLGERLNALPDHLRSALTEKINSCAGALYSQVVDVNLNSGVLQARSGALRASIELEIVAQDSRVDARIFSNGDAPYAAILEYGGKTAAHEILPDKAKALAFVLNGKRVFARRIEHPGSLFAEHAYLRSALNDMSDEIASSLRQTLVGVAGRLKDKS